jgi:hypothetical protein
MSSEATPREFTAEVARALVRIPEPESAKNPTDTRLQFIRKDHAELTRLEQDLLSDINYYLEYSKEGNELLPLHQSVLFGKIAELVHRKNLYVGMHREEDPKPISDLPMYLAIMVMALGEQQVAGTLPLQKSRAPIPPERLKTLQQRRALYQANARLTTSLRNAGLAKPPGFFDIVKKMPKEGAKVFGEVLDKAVPNSYYDIVLMAYFLQQAEEPGDKLKAAMHMGMMFVQYGLVETVIEQAAIRMSILRFVPKHPVVMTVAVLAIMFGLDKLIPIEGIIHWAEARTNPAYWDAAGNVVDMMAGSALADQAGEIGYLSGLRGVDPEVDQRKFLSQKVMMRDPEKGKNATTAVGKFVDSKLNIGRNYAHQTYDWDEYVEVAARRAEREGNPVQARLFRLEKIQGGPGGESAWGKRQSIEVYQNVGLLRGQQSTLNADLVRLGIIESERGVGAFDLVDAALVAQKEGDVGIRTLLQNQQYQKIEKGIEALREPPEGMKESPEQKAEREKSYVLVRDQFDRCVKAAKELSRIVSMHVHLGTYNSSWTKERMEDGSLLMPKDVEDGLISCIVVAAKRREALSVDSYPGMSRDRFAENVGRSFRYNNDRDPWPDILRNPIDWLERFQKYNGEYNKRRIEEIEQTVELPTVLSDVGAMTQGNEELTSAIEPIVKHIQGKKDDVAPVAMEGAVLQALAEAMPESELVPRSSESMENIARQLGTAENSSDLENLLQKFCVSGPEYHGNKGFGLTFKDSGTTYAYQFSHRFFFDRRKQCWMVDVSSTMSNPRNHGSVVLGVRKSFTEVKFPGRTIPFDEWAKSHPCYAQSVSRTLLWQEDWIDWSTKKIATLKESEAAKAHQQVETEKSDRDKARDLAKKQPSTWMKYPPQTKATQDLQDANEVPYEYVAYFPAGMHGAKACFVYLQTPEVYTGPAWRASGDSGTGKAIGDFQATRVGIQEEGSQSIERHVIKANYRNWSDPRGLAQVVRGALTMPIPGDARLSVRKLIALYQPYPSKIGKLENAVLDSYPERDPERQRRFLAHLDTEIRAVTDSIGNDGQYRELDPVLLDKALNRVRELMQS